MALDELHAFFSSVILPDTIFVSEGVKIINVPDFIQGHLQALKAVGEEPVAAVFYERLVMIKDLLINQVA
ncbi:DUF6965 family protein [Daejeonella lutea]|uniref:DUF6965 domain-containing protein n=1 Tax=Daejeonella lutea TaxID=572036 RepID=A0A1T5BI97_9SPHI|nr:hypothetical protein [Daejeonella lutea]SKB46875.1 hypothetical protein SAMN05661099_1579 [Daejeonella lutea]